MEQQLEISKNTKMRLELRKNDEFTYKVIEGHELIMKNKNIYVPKILRQPVLDWYHHFLCHPGATRLAATIGQTMAWLGLIQDAKAHVKTCTICQKSKKSTIKYGHLPPKNAEGTPWQILCVDLVGPYTVTLTKEKVVTLHAMTFIDPATGWFEICAIPDKYSSTMSQH